MSKQHVRSPTRRSILAAAAGTFGVGLGSGVVSGDSTSCPGCTCDSSSRSGVEDATDRSEVCTCLYDFQPFDPTALRVTTGTQVAWKNAGSLPHNVNIVAGTGDEEPGRIGTVGSGATICHTFDEPGTYYVRCEIDLHETTMHQTVTVESDGY